MLLSEVFKSSVHRGKLPIQSLQRGCLSLAVVGGGSKGKWRLSNDGHNQALQKKKTHLVCKIPLSSFMSADVSTNA